MRSLIFTCLFLATPAVAQEPMTAAEFDAYTKGKTLTFGTIGDPTYGIERYMSDRRVIWSFGQGDCQAGVWHEEEGDICFVYEGQAEAQCWLMYDEPKGLRAVFQNRPNTTVITEARERKEPLICNDLFS